MKTDNSGIVIEKLANHLINNFVIGPITAIDFVPKGEGGYAYAVSTKHGQRYFVKAEKTQAALNSALQEVWRLQHEFKKNYVLAPLLSNKGTAAEALGDYSISVYPYVEGISIYEKDHVQDDIEAVATMMADLHQIDSSTFSELPREQFDHPFGDTIRKILDAAADHSFDPGSCQQMASGLLLKERQDILATLQKMDTLKEKLQHSQIAMCITHGDANYANIMCDKTGRLHLIDWGEIAVGPPERDLMSFTEEHFETLLQVYMNHRPHTIIHEELFEFYLYRWCLQEIADYGGSLILQSNSDEVNRHSWEEIQPYLPIDHDSITNTVMHIRRCITP